jgi:hypothetical protein
MEGVLGLEPRTTESKSVELPLLHTPIKMNLRVVVPMSSQPLARLYKSGRAAVRHLGYRSSIASDTGLRSSPRVGVEPINLLLFRSFEET